MLMRLREFVDSWFGSERYYEIDAGWLAEVEDRMYKVTRWRKYPATRLKLKNGREYWVKGHHESAIKAAQRQGEAAEPAGEMVP